MAEVSSEILKSQIEALIAMLNGLDKIKQSLAAQYQAAGADWKDEKYKALGQYEAQFRRALTQLQKRLLEGTENLAVLYQQVQTYEQTNLKKSGTQPMTRQLTGQEVNQQWKAFMQGLDADLSAFREALQNRGVPEGRWLDRRVAQERARMLEQKGYDLDAASGHREDTTNRGDRYTVPADYGAYHDQNAADFLQDCITECNPNYSTEPDHVQWSNNCQRCVPTYEARRRGMDVTAFSTKGRSSHLALYPFDVWENPQVLFAAGSGKDGITDSMQSWGDGARAQVVVYWDTPTGGGHTFMAEQRNGKTIFFDPQTGEEAVDAYFDRVIPNRTMFCRIDNLEFSDYFADCCEERPE